MRQSIQWDRYLCKSSQSAYEWSSSKSITPWSSISNICDNFVLGVATPVAGLTVQSQNGPSRTSCASYHSTSQNDAYRTACPHWPIRYLSHTEKMPVCASAGWSTSVRTMWDSWGKRFGSFFSLLAERDREKDDRRCCLSGFSID